MRIEEVIKQFNSLRNNIEVVNLSAAEFDQMLISDKDTKDRNGISDAIMISLKSKHELFRQYKNGIVTFDHFKNNFTTTLCLGKNSYFQRKFTECSNNSRDTWKTLNSLFRYKNTNKDVTLNHNGSSISDSSVIAKVFNNNFSNIASNHDSDIPHSNISPLCFRVAPVENSFI